MTNSTDVADRVTFLARPSLFRDALVSALRTHGLVVDTGPAASSEPVSCHHVFLLAGGLPSELIGQVAELRRRSPETPVLVLVPRPDRAANRLVSAVGADGWLAADTSVEELARDLVRAARGEVRRVRPCTEMQSAKPGSLTARELEILRAVAGGASDQEAARLLRISIHTVRSHLQSARDKLGAGNRFTAVALARQAGTLDGPG